MAVLALSVSMVTTMAADRAHAQQKDTELPGISVESAAAAKKSGSAPSAPAPKPAAPAAPSVAATSPQDAAYETPAGVSAVGQDEIQTFGQAGLDSVLRTVPGTFTRESPNNAGVAVNIRGFEGSGRVNMMIDGARQNFRFTGHEAQGFTYIDPLLLAGIEVQRGAVSTAGGAGALAGTANFRTLGVEDILKPGQTEGVLSIGSWGSNGLGWSGMTAGAVTNGNVGVAAAVSKHDENDYKNGDGIIVPYTFQDPTSGLVKLDFKLTDEQTLKFGGVFYDNDFLANSYFQHLKSNTFTGKYAYDPIGNDLVHFRLNGYRNDVTMHYGTDFDPNHSPPPANPGPPDPPQGTAAGRVIDDQGWGFDTSNTSRFRLGGVRVESLYGYEYFADDVFVINSTRTPNRGVNPSGDSSVGGLFSQTTFSYGVFDLIGGLRYDTFSLQGSGSVVAGNPLGMPAGAYVVDKDVDRWNPKITLAAHVTDWFQPYVTYSESLRAPTISETLTGGSHPATTPGQVFFPNPFLDPEIQKGWEFGGNIRSDGVFVRRDSVRFKADYFTQKIDNYITACLGAQGATYFCNARGISDVSGVELQGMYDTGSLFAGLGYTYTKTDLPSQIAGFGGSNYLPDSVLTLTAGLRFLQQKLTMGARGYIVSEAYNGADQVQKFLPPGFPNPNGDPNNPFSAGYELLDVFSNYKFDNGVELAFTATNVFDLAYTPALSTPTTNFTGETGRGRTFLLTTRAQF